MDEGNSKAIPLRRSRAATRSISARAPRWREGLEASLRGVLSPPRQVWLVALGGAGLTARGARTLWSHLVSEGVAVEASLRRALSEAVAR